MLGFDKMPLTDRQRRTRAWLGEHPGLTTLGAASIFGLLGLQVGAVAGSDVPWLGPLLGAALGAAGGACAGWGLSQEHKQLTGSRRLLFYAAFAVILLMAIAGTVLNAL